MEQLRVFIVEDELPAQNLLEIWIKSIPQLLLCGIYADGFSALKAIQEEKPDLVLLDIEMPRLNGLEILELLENPPQIIFTTAYHEYAVKAFELAAIDYLLKPFSLERFKQSIDKALLARESRVPNLKKLLPRLKAAKQEHKPIDRIVVKNGAEVQVIPISELVCIEAQDDYVMIYTENKNHLKLASLRSIEESLPKSEFVRVHRSYIVNVNAISKIEHYTKDSYQLVLSNGKQVKISRSGLALLREVLHL